MSVLMCARTAAADGPSRRVATRTASGAPTKGMSRARNWARVIRRMLASYHPPHAQAAVDTRTRVLRCRVGNRHRPVGSFAAGREPARGPVAGAVPGPGRVAPHGDERLRALRAEHVYERRVG